MAQASKRQKKLPGYQADRDLLLEPRSLKGLAHPIRLRLRAALVERGPATATQLAAQIGESSGSTSYHLRQLAAYGFVEEDPSRGKGRERYWRSVHRGTWYLGSTEPAAQEVAGEFLRAVAHTYADRILRFANSIDPPEETLGPDWAHAWNASDWTLDLTAGQAEQLTIAFHEACAPFRHEPGREPPGTRLVHVQFQILPTTRDETQCAAPDAS